MTELDRRTYLKTAGIVAAGTVGLAGCSGTASATGTLATQVTDQPGDFTPVRRGQAERYLLQPVARGTKVTYGDATGDTE